MSLYELVHEVKKGNTEAAAEIVALFEPKLKKFSRSLPEHQQEDLRQEVRLEIVRVIHRFETDRTPGFFEFLQSFEVEGC
ncbi:helix-turn-helix domain-containing protein [Bacillus sp. RAR_GA_16]|uniref:helix-turn-helix domain-containing protein n=1 Tax=Bacillus sp. RAR_GA_16 TaxID=2876774 RepID=UPI001CCA92D6|nr:helix-turn-helix domain-containing protein [Bacillus sp. RAR_GA_16]